LSKSQKKLLLERHFISIPLANNPNGAVIIERVEHPQMSVMVNEEDHFREQCVVDGHNLIGAYKRVHEYDLRLNEVIPLAYDAKLGYLTACPTNVGTGMRASEMLFLPALRRTGAIDDALKKVVKESGLTVRGYFGEGSDCAYDMYQISNSRTFGVSEINTVWQVEQAVLRLCYLERVALEKLFEQQNTSLLDGISRSYGVLMSAYSLTAQELMKLLVDVKLGVILGVLPIKSMARLNAVIEECSSSIEIKDENMSEDERNKDRARKVHSILAEGKC
ncbi:MAG: ATP--guanido phosphotransferase, partial [Clostridia bacterium]|nr:ATP--guanido phosphotransferase [Clostridia bacterium]